MTDLWYRVKVTLTAHTIAYVPLAGWLVYEDHAGITVLIVPPVGIALAAIWAGWRVWIAVGDVRAIAAGLRARPLADVDYLPGAVRPHAPVNRAA